MNASLNRLDAVWTVMFGVNEGKESRLPYLGVGQRAKEGTQRRPKPRPFHSGKFVITSSETGCASRRPQSHRSLV